MIIHVIKLSLNTLINDHFDRMKFMYCSVSRKAKSIEGNAVLLKSESMWFEDLNPSSEWFKLYRIVL